MSYLISIIIPFYNGEKFIERCLNSLINQSIGFEKLEVIIIDDKSTDSSLKIIKKYCKSYENINYIKLDVNSGHPGKPRNIGIDIASSDYLMFLDQDDFYEKKCCEILYNEITEKKIDIVSGQWYKLDDGVKIPSSLEEDIYIDNISENPEILSFPAFIWVKIFKKSFIQKNNIYFPEDGIEDVVFNSKALLNANGIFYLKDKQVYTHYINPKSISRSKNKKYLNQLLIGYNNTFKVFKHSKHPNYYSFFIKMRLNYFLNVLIDSHLEDIERKKMLNELYNLSNHAISNGTAIEGKLKVLLDLIAIDDFESETFFIKYMEISKKRANDNKILKEKNKKLLKRNIELRDRNIEIKKKHDLLNEKYNNILPFKRYITYKIKNLKNRFLLKIKK